LLHPNQSLQTAELFLSRFPNLGTHKRPIFNCIDELLQLALGRVLESQLLSISVDAALLGGVVFTRPKRDPKNAREMENPLQVHSSLAIFYMATQISQGFLNGGTAK
jgi:hypothetical protein